MTGVAAPKYFVTLHRKGKGPPFVLRNGKAWYPLKEFIEWLDTSPPNESYIGKRGRHRV